jgi:hypothetical protein
MGPKEALLPESDFWSVRSKNAKIVLMCENSALFKEQDLVRCQVFSKGNDMGSVIFTDKEISVFDVYGKRKEVLLYGGGGPIRINMRD